VEEVDSSTRLSYDGRGERRERESEEEVRETNAVKRPRLRYG